MTKRNSNNPWARRWRNLASEERGQEKKAMQQEARWAEQEKQTFPCTCGGTAHYRPGVGGWWCDKCGELVQ